MWGLSPAFSGSHLYIWNVFSLAAGAATAAVALQRDSVLVRRERVEGRNDAMLDTHYLTDIAAVRIELSNTR